jgi:hypothetical protein
MHLIIQNIFYIAADNLKRKVLHPALRGGGGGGSKINILHKNYFVSSLNFKLLRQKNKIE